MVVTVILVMAVPDWWWWWGGSGEIEIGREGECGFVVFTVHTLEVPLSVISMG